MQAQEAERKPFVSCDPEFFVKSTAKGRVILAAALNSLITGLTLLAYRYVDFDIVLKINIEKADVIAM